jgi:hypothetical protein
VRHPPETRLACRLVADTVEKVACCLKQQRCRDSLLRVIWRGSWQPPPHSLHPYHEPWPRRGRATKARIRADGRGDGAEARRREGRGPEERHRNRILNGGRARSADTVKVDVPRAIVAGISRFGIPAERNSACAIGATTKKATKRLTPPKVTRAPAPASTTASTARRGPSLSVIKLAMAGT